MKEIKAVWGFDHIPDGTGYSGYSDMSATPTGGTWNQASFVGTFNGRRWLGGTSNIAYAVLNVLDLNFNWTKRLIFGARCWTSIPAQFRIWSFFNSGPNAVAVGEVLGSNIGMPANQECYIEMEIDVVGQKRNFYLDGNPVPAFTQAMTTAQIASILTTFPYAIIGVFSTANTWWIRDVVFRHCSGADDIAIMGPVDLTLWSPSAVTLGAGFAGKAGVPPAQALSTFMVDKVLSPVTPRVESYQGSVGGTVVARLGVDSTKIYGAVKAVSVFSSTQDIADTPHTLTAKLTQNSIDAALPSVLQKATWQYGKTHSVLMTAPDGSDWAPAKINATDLTLAIT